MLVDVKQNELDIAEERLLTNLFGSTTIDARTEWLLKFLNIDINNYIQNFENVIKPLMLDNGMVNSTQLRSLVSDKYPLLVNLVPSTDFRIVDIVDTLTILLKGVKR